MIYKKYDDLKNNILKENDIVIFFIKNKTYSYTVKSTYLSCDFHPNYKIFDMLDIINKYKFCSLYYEYSTHSGDFPTYKLHDYKAATKLVLELLKLCDNYINYESFWN